MKYYEVDLFPVVYDKHQIVEPVAVVMLKSITQVAKFVDTINMEYLIPQIWSPNNKEIDTNQLLKIWRS